MGVKGLWELLHPVARPIKMDSLSNKHLAIDASIWLHQFLRGMRDKDGQAIGNAHILGFYRRICKLLYFNVKPIFVFDGGTPALKRLTIVERRKQRRNNENMVKKTAEKLLAAQLRLQALEQHKLARKQDLKALNDSQPGAVHDSIENPVYLEELLDPSKSFDKKDKLPELSSNNYTGTGSYGGGSKAKRVQDKFVLPPMETDFDTLAKIRSHDERFGYHAGEDDVSAFLEDFKKEEGLNNIDSDVFKALPSEMQYEILQEIRQRSRVTSFERVQEMVRLAETPMDFSKLQVQGVIRRNTVTHKLLTVNQTVSKVEETVKPGRIASQRNRQYLLVKNEEGGWVLGGRKPTTGATADKPVQLDSDDEGDQIKKEIKAEVACIESEIKEEDDEEGWESDDDDDLEMVEVKDYIPPVQPAATLRSLAPRTNSSLEDENSLVNHPEAYVDEDESIEKVMAKFAEIEDEAARKRGIVSGLAGTEALPMDVDELDSFDTLNSLDTVYSDATLDDMDDFEDLMEDEDTGEIQVSQVGLSSPMESLKQPERAPDDLTKSLSISLHLDFGSSILKQRSGVTALPMRDDVVKTPEDTSLTTIGVVPQVDARDLAIDVDVEPTVSKEEEDHEDEAHSADLENEEQDFTNLFPDMASLPGALLISKEDAPTRTAEEQKAMDEQEAAKMFEESRQLQSEIKGLRNQHRKHQRNAEDLTESMIAETQMLLKLFGIPYIVAPMEAEAQCADLQLRGVVEGILTEDSDVFLFGGIRVFKNVFREEKYVECYLMSDIERDLGVGRDRLVSLAYLLGSDYTTGIKGVGLVTAMEILRLFPKLEDFAKWWRGEQVKQDKADGDSEAREKSLDELGMELDREIHLPSTFPDPHIADAYVHPMVDDDDAKFQWGIPDLDGLRDYLRKSMSWDRGEVDRVLLPIIRQLAAQASQQQTQTTLDSFFDSTIGIAGYHNPARKHLIKSARLRKVVN
ncbi:MAG: hypothetical protein JOS17DRAFT_673316, partial [Linnemannia elongata]